MTNSQIVKALRLTAANIPYARAVYRQLGYTMSNKDYLQDFAHTLIDTARHGADAGVGGFVYYTETCKFAQKHMRAILQKVYELEFETGTVTEQEGTYRDPDETTADNWLAWFALESVAHEFVNQLEDLGVSV